MHGDIGKLTMEGIRASWRFQRVLAALADNTSINLHDSSDFLVILSLIQ